MSCLKYSNSLSVEFYMVCPRGGGIFSLYLGFRKKTGPMYMGHHNFFFFPTLRLMPHTSPGWGGGGFN